MTNYEQIAKEAEADLNTYQAKTGKARPQADDDAGVNSYATKKFDNAEVQYGDDLSTNRGYNKRIPPNEGGITDDRGRQTRGELYDGDGGPLDKLNKSYEEQPGQNDNDVVPAPVRKTYGEGSTNDILSKGQDAVVNNVGTNPPGPGGSQFKGSDYYTPESVPGSISAEGYEAPSSVTQASKETEGYR